MISSILPVGFICVAAFVISRSLASAIDTNLPPPSSLAHRAISQACDGFEGNSDLYGLGIRLGVYLQWVSSWLIQTLNPNGIMTTHDTNSIFVLAILVAMISATARGRHQTDRVLYHATNRLWVLLHNPQSLRGSGALRKPDRVIEVPKSHEANACLTRVQSREVGHILGTGC